MKQSRDVSLKRFNTFGVPALARRVIQLDRAEDLAECALYPRLEGIRDISAAVAAAVVRRAVDEGHAEEEQLDGLEDRLAEAMWFPEYRRYLAEPQA